VILKLILGRGFRGVLTYVSDGLKSATTDHKGAVQPFFTNMAGRSSRELSAEFGVLRRLRPNLTKAVGHLILSQDPKQRNLTEEEWKEAVNIALSTHGADQTMFAAWQHHDTKTSHLHVIFSRVLITNQVVSDSNSFRKNEIAARQIERTFMLDSPIPTPTADQPGDRKALANAKKRAERTGTIDTAQISPQTVRDALAAAKDLDGYKRLLDDRDIEIEFDRRGVQLEIYGCRLRRKGTAEWLKASSIHKDLSWPKIAHRFAEAPTAQAKPATSLVAAVPSEPKRNLVQKSQQQYRYAAQTTKWRLDTTKSAGEQYIPGSLGPVFQACLMLTAEAINLMLSLWEKIVAFIKSILARLGIGVAAAPSNQLTLEPNPPIDVDARFVDDPLLIEQATESIGQVADAISKRDPSLLPAGPGREELVAAMNNEFAEQGSSEERDPFGFMPHGDQDHDHAMAAPTPSPFSLFLAAKAKHVESQTVLKAAMDADAQGENLWNGREVRDAKEKELRASNDKLQSIKNNSKEWGNHSFFNKLVGRIGANPHDEPAAQAEARVAKLTAELRSMGPAIPRYTRAEVLAIQSAQAAEKEAGEAIHRAKIEVMATAKAALGSTPNAELLLEVLRKSGYDEAKLRSALVSIKNAARAERERLNPAAFDDEAARLLNELAEAPKG
jgi:hypothetical protein